MAARIALLGIAFGAPILAYSSPPLTGAIPLAPHNSYCAMDQDSCTPIGQPAWCCETGARCVYARGGVVACCDYSEPCDGEVGGATPPTSTYHPAAGAGHGASSTSGAMQTVVMVASSDGNAIIPPSRILFQMSLSWMIGAVFL